MNCHALTTKASVNPTGSALELGWSFRVVSFLSKVAGPLYPSTVFQSLDVSCPQAGAVTLNAESIFYLGQTQESASTERPGQLRSPNIRR